MIKLAFIDDGIPASVARKFPKLKVNYFGIRNGCVYRQMFRPHRQKMTHAGLCFYEYAVHARDMMAEVYSINMVMGKKGTVKDLVAALQWCMDNGIGIVNLSVGSRNYWDYFELQPVLKEMSERKIVIVAAHSNCYQFSFPAISKYSVSARFDNCNLLTGGTYAITDRALPNREFVFPKQEISDFVKKYVDVKEECNSMAAPLLSALIAKTISYSKDNAVDELLRNSIKLGGLQLWNIRRLYIKEQNIKIPVILFTGNPEKSWNLIVRLTEKFQMRDYHVLAMGNTIDESELPYFKLEDVLSNCNGDICKAVVFMQNYSAADVMLVQMENGKDQQLMDAGMSEIVIRDNQTFQVDSDNREYSDIRDLFHQLMDFLT